MTIVEYAISNISNNSNTYLSTRWGYLGVSNYLLFVILSKVFPCLLDALFLSFCWQNRLFFPIATDIYLCCITM